MSVPKFYMFFKSMLHSLEDGSVRSAKEMRVLIANEMKLSDEQLSELISSGKQTTFSNRVAWAKTYLNKAGLLSIPKRGYYQITEEGKKALSSGEKIDLEYLERYESFRVFHSYNNADGVSFNQESILEKDESPMEILDSAFKQVNNTLASELMDQVMQLSSTEFESLVVRLLLQMGYGSGINDAGIVTKQTNDGGIDGIIKEDQLGFSSIYIQAKQWALERTVDRPEVQKFAGALQGEKATKGLFITTASFSSGARLYAENLRGSTIVLIDGKQMMHLMIKYNLGVSTIHIYEVKRVDSDFFNDTL